jgi:putative nucleotidyltransferase with HDIG domain
MQSSDLLKFKKWFTWYSRSFHTGNSEDDKNLDLKIRHTFLVCENAVLIAREELLNDNDVLLAETAALFHDVGRFLQYSRHKTFRDSISLNHGRLGADILNENEVLSEIPADEQKLIVNTVRFHNVFEIPPLEDQRKLLFLRLIRDADKLDIWRVFAEYFASPEEEQASAAGLGLPDSPEYSQAVLSCLYGRKLAPISGLKTINDFKLMQLSWIYGLHFRQSFRLMAENDFIRRIASALPQTTEIAGALEMLKKFVNEKIASFHMDYPGLPAYWQSENKISKIQ